MTDTYLLSLFLARVLHEKVTSQTVKNFRLSSLKFNQHNMKCTKTEKIRVIHLDRQKHNIMIRELFSAYFLCTDFGTL